MMRARDLSLPILAAAVAVLLAAGPSQAQPGDVENGERVYTERCTWCHGEDGDGLGPVEERLNPPPRDFTGGQYKIKTTAFDDIVPNDDDLFRMVRDGMPGTAMPGWADVLSEQEMWDLVAFIKTFAGYDEETPTSQVDYGTQVASSAESIEKGRQLYFDGDRCSECHGVEGKGDAIKKLKGDNGERTWPRNLTKPWTFRASADPKDIFTRITVGIPGTQMPSFADPQSKKSLGIEERWHIANYVVSLAKTTEVVRSENTVVKAAEAEGGVPEAPDDPRWEEAPPSTFFLVPQIIAKERFFTPSNDTITVRAFYDEKIIAVLLEWDDRTKSIPGDAKAESIADPDMGEDSVAIQLPVVIPEGMEKPYFSMGDPAKPVNIWQWTSGTTDRSETVRLLTGRGFGDIEERDLADAGITARGIYKTGTWRVVMTRPRMTAKPENDIQLVEGKFIPVAFAAWDGSNGETGSKHTMTTWYWLLLEPQTGTKPYFVAIGVVIVIVAGQFAWVRSAARSKANDSA